ncbi:MAG: adenylate/guanylate cyclase domain-containing protein [Thermohalobaculum sp.]
MERRLAAILVADVVGYSRLMGADEEGTLTRLKAHRDEVIHPSIDTHKGRIVKLMGDGLLAEFASVVDAVRCAVDIQEAMSERNADLPEGQRIQLRIGINLGDIIIEGDDIYGDGVNVAARMEGLAEPGGICMSRTVVDHVKGKVELDFEDMGEQQVKNISEPIRVYRVASDALAVQTVRSPSTVLPLPDKPSIAVLPFVNLSGDPEQEYFSDGITEDLITTLSRILGLFVIARTSSFMYKGKAVDVKQVSRDLGVRYVLEGSVRTAADRVRVTAQLIDAHTGLHLWANRYDRDLTDVFAVQDEITTNVVKALQVALVEGEQARVWHRSTDNVEAWGCLTRAVMHSNKLTREEDQIARKLLEEALQLDPDYAAAWVWLGQTYRRDVRFLWVSTPDKSLAKAAKCAERARALDDDYSELHALLGAIHLIRGEFGAAIESCERAVALEPNGAWVTGFLGNALNWAGRPEEALILAQKAMRFSPLHPSWYVWTAAHANRLLGRYEKAVVLYQRAINRTPDYISPRIGLTACYAEMGRLEDARAQAAEVLRIDPRYSIGRYATALTYTYKLPEHAQHNLDALREAGLPE